LTFLRQATASPVVLTNCRKRLSAAAKPFVLGEDYTEGTVNLLVNGWWRIQVLLPMTVFVAQVNPRDADADPFERGIVLGATLTVPAPVTADFFVDDALIDGILVIQQCGMGTAALCGQAEIPLAIVSRLESVLLPSETGDTTSAEKKRPAAAAESLCGPVK